MGRGALAAKLYTTVDKPNAAIGDEVTVNVKIDSEGVGVNAVQATLSYPVSALAATSVIKTGSVINFWVDEPVFDNSKGELSFTGGSADGLNGTTLQVIRVVFKVLGSGTANIVFSDGAVTAADGSGTSVLSSMVGSQINVGPSSGVVAAPPAEVVVPPLVQIKREPVKAQATPLTPNVVVELYPDPAKAYNTSAVFSAKWDLPLDISDVATAINTQKGFNPTKSEGLFESKSFKPLEDGSWYLHIRFKNNIGWGAAAHYRLMIDTVKPQPFEIKIADGTAADDPAPEILYETADEFSGLAGYTVQIDNKEAAATDKGSFKPAPLSPGKHNIKVIATDNAGNSLERALEIDIVPIEKPVITSFTKTVFVGEGALDISGAAIPGVDIILELRESTGKNIFSTSVKVGTDGNWFAKIDQALTKGRYTITATARDARGAMSLPAAGEVTVRERPFLTIGGLELSKAWLLLMVVVIMAGGFGVGWRFQMLSKAQRSRKVTIAARDVNVVFGLIKKDVDAVLEKYKEGLDETEFEETKFLLQRLNTNLDKLRKYLSQNIEEIND